MNPYRAVALRGPHGPGRLRALLQPLVLRLPRSGRRWKVCRYILGGRWAPYTSFWPCDDEPETVWVASPACPGVAPSPDMDCDCAKYGRCLCEVY